MNCPKCQNPIKLVPAGVSKKTGKPYNAFYSCSNRECDYTAQAEQPVYEPIKNPEAMFVDEIQAGFKEVNERLDKLIQYIVTHLK